MTACAQERSPSVSEQQLAIGACDRIRAEAFPGTVNGEVEIMIGERFALDSGGTSGQFSVTYSWSAGGNARVALKCRGDWLSHTVSSVEFYGVTKTAAAGSGWRY
jgi:hypothetical protein